MAEVELCSGALATALQPEQHEAKDGNQKIHIKDHSSVSRREIASGDDLVEMADSSAKKEERRPGYRRHSKIEAAPESEKTDNRISQACEADLCLEWTILPTNEARRHFSEKTVQHEVVEQATANREKQEVGKQRLNHSRRSQRLGRAKQRHG